MDQAAKGDFNTPKPNAGTEMIGVTKFELPPFTQNSKQGKKCKNLTHN